MCMHTFYAAVPVAKLIASGKLSQLMLKISKGVPEPPPYAPAFLLTCHHSYNHSSSES